MLEEAPAAQSRMLESAPAMESAPVSDDVSVMAESASDTNRTAPVEGESLVAKGYQQYDDAWFNWAIAGVVLSATACALSLRWLVQVWWRRRHQRL
jgi:hypothetical protein